jgi:hypothetical protein
MALITQRVDDIDGSPDAAPIPFALDGTAYEVDLSPENAAALREVLAPYVDAARRIKRPRAAGK